MIKKYKSVVSASFGRQDILNRKRYLVQISFSNKKEAYKFYRLLINGYITMRD